MKCWLLTANNPVLGVKKHYCAAYAKENPGLIMNPETFDIIIELLWADYSYMLLDKKYKTAEEEDEVWEKTYKQWYQDCTINFTEIDESELKDYFPEEPNIIYDERINIDTRD